jgi:UDPglucose--hexose-1-phosphate uridylyltransferase
MERFDTVLSDGRVLRYYGGGAARQAAYADTRDLPGTVSAIELRTDPWTGEPVMLAAHRQARTFLPRDDACPLCPSRPGHASEIPAPDYEMVVFDNRFPSLDASVGGACEVVCYTDDHATGLAGLDDDRVGGLVAVLADRTAELAARPGVRQVFPFENRGVEIGVTLTHAHGQIYAYPFVPPLLDRYHDAASDHAERTGRCLACDLLAAERADGSRVVLEDDGVTAYVPRGGRWPFEVHVVPHACVRDLPDLVQAGAAGAVGRVWRDVVRRLDALHGTAMPLTAGWVQAGVDDLRDQHVHLRLQPNRRAPGKLKYLAGSETGAGAFALDVAPEAAAEALRAVG